MDTPRDRDQRRTDSLARLESDLDVWVATSSPEGMPHLVPLSLDWDGQRIVVCARRESRTIENLTRSSSARLGIGPTRDVVMIDAVAEELVPADQVSTAMAEHYALRTGWDPRREAGHYMFVCLRPQRVQAWHESNEIRGRTLMRNGKWL
jgi:hypothetical protein